MDVSGEGPWTSRSGLLATWSQCELTQMPAGPAGVCRRFRALGQASALSAAFSTAGVGGSGPVTDRIFTQIGFIHVSCCRQRVP